MTDWLVPVAKYQAVGRAREKLEDIGFRCYQPKSRDRVVVRGRATWVERFYLGPYLFVEWLGDWQRQFADMMSTGCLVSVLSVDDRPLVARGHEVDRLTSGEVRGFIPAPVPMTGTPGRVRDGIFSGFPARFEARRELVDDILINLFGRFVKMPVPRGAWEPA